MRAFVNSLKQSIARSNYISGVQALAVAGTEDMMAPQSSAAGTFCMSEVRQHAFLAACEALSLLNSKLEGASAAVQAMLQPMHVPVDADTAAQLADYLLYTLDGKAAAEVAVVDSHAHLESAPQKAGAAMFFPVLGSSTHTCS